MAFGIKCHCQVHCHLGRTSWRAVEVKKYARIQPVYVFAQARWAPLGAEEAEKVATS